MADGAVAGDGAVDAGERHRQRRVAAIARTAANLASQGSLVTVLDALAAEVLQTDALAAVQIVTLDATGRQLRIMGSAGFGHWPDFFDRLMECRRRGAALRMLEAFSQTEPVLVTNRWQVISGDPAWAPLREYLGELAWDSFASIPMTARGQAVGVLNAFFAPGQAMEARTIEFLGAMADQAAIAVDYATLLRHTRDGARRDERQRLARDLHDSIVQQVFSISVQAKSLEVLARRGPAVPAADVQRIAGEVGGLSGTVLADLRAMVHELRLSSSADLGGLEEAVRALAESTANRTGLTFSVSGGPGLERVRGELAEDAYRIVAEAIHNVVRHAGAGKVTIRLSLRGDRLTASVADDGQGTGAAPTVARQRDAPAGYGLTIMRERAERWGGTVTVGPGRSRGTLVRLAVPLHGGIPLGPAESRGAESGGAESGGAGTAGAGAAGAEPGGGR
jgi:signal transduction histidine kinase